VTQLMNDNGPNANVRCTDEGLVQREYTGRRAAPPPTSHTPELKVAIAQGLYPHVSHMLPDKLPKQRVGSSSLP
jgi:hypothetical protein